MNVDLKIALMEIRVILCPSPPIAKAVAHGSAMYVLPYWPRHLTTGNAVKMHSQ